MQGTGPIEFGEWLSDLDATMVPLKDEDNKDYIDGFQKVHKGFKDRVFPDNTRQTQKKRPYNTISQSVKALVAELRPRLKPGQKVRW